MRFLIRVANRGNYRASDAKTLASTSYNLVREYGADVGNLRVSGPAIELDLLIGSTDNLRHATDALEEKLGPLLSVRELDTPPPQMDTDQAIHEGVQFFNEERYWESHEAFEYAWRRAEGPDKEMLQGIILAAAALVHLQKNERAVALGVMARANEKLAAHHGEHFGISIDNLREVLSRMVAAGHPDFFTLQPEDYSRRDAA
jgi:uncharacterized protein